MPWYITEKMNDDYEENTDPFGDLGDRIVAELQDQGASIKSSIDGLKPFLEVIVMLAIIALFHFW
jgi:hypothetical protein